MLLMLNELKIPDVHTWKYVETIQKLLKLCVVMIRECPKCVHSRLNWSRDQNVQLNPDMC